MKDRVVLTRNLLFELDQDSKLLVQIGNRTNIIPLRERMDGYGCKVSEHILTGSCGNAPLDTDQTVDIFIPFHYMLNTAPINDGYISNLNDASLINDWNVYFLKKEMIPRAYGILPETKVHDQDFIVDVDYGVIREILKHSNLIPFSAMKYDNTSYHFDFNPTFKNIALPWHNPSDSVPAQVLQMRDYDPLGMAMKYNLRPDQLPSWDCDFKCDPELLDLAKLGYPAELRIGHLIFSSDFQKKELVNVDDANMKLKIEKLNTTDDGLTHSCFWHKPSNTFSAKPLSPDGTYKDIFLVDFPHIKILDSYAAAQKTDDPLKYLNQYPVRKNFQASVTPIAPILLHSIVLREKYSKPLEKNSNNKRQHKKRGKSM